MFYIYDVFDKSSSYRAKDLYVYPNYDRFNISGNVMSCGYREVNSITIGVFDSSDGVTEYYTVVDLLNLVARTGVEIKGMRIDYYANVRKGLTKTPNCLEAIKCAAFIGRLADNSKDYVRNLAKQKLVNGIEISSEGVLLSSIHNLIKGDTLEIPKEVRRLSFGFIPSNEVKGVKRVIVYNTFNFKDSYNVRSLSYLCENCNKLIIVGDFHLTPTLFKILTVDMFVTGKLSVGSFSKYMKDIATIGRNNLTAVTKCGEHMKYMIADSSSIYTIDFNNFTVRKQKNNGLVSI